MSASSCHLVKRYLCVKKLSVNDGFTNKSVKIPRAEGRFFMGELRNRQAIPLVLLDEDGNCWDLLCTCTGAQYALSRIGAFCEAHGARPGWYFIFYADHEHIVRLAVREQLPEDVQAAVAAARAAAMAVRSGPPRAEQEQQQQPGAAVSTSTASLPAGQTAAQPVLDDPVALDEMPLSAVSNAAAVACVHVGAVPRVPAPVKQLSPAEPPPKSMPLQDRSNLPAGVPLCDAVSASAKPKPTGGKPPNHSATVNGATLANHAVPAADKENDATALTGQRVQQQAGAPWPIVSTGGLQAPATHIPLQQSPGPRPTPPPPSPQTPSSPQLPRSPPCQPSPSPSPSPGTRLRLRFEARLRAQVGRLHPLSVRTGPDSPPPSPLAECGSGGSYGTGWPAALSGFYPLYGGGAYLSSGCLPPVWGAVGSCGHPVAGLNPDCAGPCANRQHEPSVLYPFAATENSVAGPGYTAGSSARQQQCGMSQGVTAAAAAQQHQQLQQQQSREDWRQQLQCEELLDWEVGRRATGNAAAALSKPANFGAGTQPTFPRYHVQPPPPPQPTGSCLAAGPMVTPKMNLGLLRQLLLLQGVHPTHPLYSGPIDSGTRSDSGPQQPQRRAAPEGPPDRPLATQPTLLPATGQEGLLASLVAANPALRQLLSMSAAWDFAAWSSGAVGLPGQTSGGGCRHQGNLNLDPSSPHAPVSSPAAHKLPLANGSAAGDAANALGGSHWRPSCSPPGAQPQGCGGAADSCMDVECAATTAMQEQEQEAQQGGEAATGNGARPKSRLSIERDARGMPLDPPSCKRHRAASRQMVASKTLTAHDLLTDRVALSVAPAACLLLASLLLPRGGHAIRGEAAATGTPLGQSGGSSLLQEQASAQPGPASQQPAGAVDSSGGMMATAAALESNQRHQQQQLMCNAASVPVDVLVESGARYEGVLVLRGASGGSAGREWELQGLRPYLIRRQAGVGDVLALDVADTDQPTGSCLRLVAQLRHCEAAA